MCFTNFILTKGTCGELTPTSGYYTDDIGFSREILNKTFSSPYISGEELSTDKVDLAIKQTKNDILTALRPKLKAKTIVDGRRIGYSEDDLNMVAGSKLKGLEIEICDTDDYLDLYISQISLQVNVSQAINILVYDLITGLLLDTIPITTVTNQRTTIYPAKTYRSNNKRLLLGFFYDSNGISSNRTLLSKGGCTSCGSKGYWPNSMVKCDAVEIDSADDKLPKNTDGIAETGGMSLVYSVNCNQEDWLCEKANTLGLAVLYKTGLNLIDYILDDSQRENRHTLIDRDSFKEKREKLETEYDRQIQNTLNNMDLPLGRCFSCIKPIKYAFIKP